MKKIIKVLFVGLMLICLAGCNIQEELTKDFNNGESFIEKTIVKNNDGEIGIDTDYFSSLLEYHELTTENWRDYIKAFAYQEEIINKDAFGEPVYEKDENGNDIHNMEDRYYLGGISDTYYHFDWGTTIELQNNETGEKVIYDISGEGAKLYEEINLDDYTCTRIKGNIYFANLPEEVVGPLEFWGYECGFQIIGRGSCTPYRINKYTKGIETNGSGTWLEHYIDKE